MNRGVFGSDHEQFRQSVAEFVTRFIEPRHDEFISEKLISRDVWLEAGKQGYLGLDVPTGYGGSAAFDYRFNAVVIEELAKRSAALASSLSIHFDVVAPYLVELADDGQRERWLPGFSRGELVAAIAMTEPSGGSDLAALRTSARQDGSDWIIDGAKTFVTNGYSADLIVLAARTRPDSGAKGITLFVVETGSPGFSRGRKLDKVGQPEADTAELFFNAVRVPRENVLGEVDRGFIHMMERLPRERVGCAVANTANAIQLMSETVAYAHDRRAFGRSIGAFQHNKFQLAEMSTKLDVTRAFVDQCVSDHARGELTSVDAAKAKWWSAQVQNDALDACVQIFGGYGYMSEYRIARAWQDARVTKIWGGSNEIMKELIGRDLGF